MFHREMRSQDIDDALDICDMFDSGLAQSKSTSFDFMSGKISKTENIHTVKVRFGTCHNMLINVLTPKQGMEHLQPPSCAKVFSGVYRVI